MPDPNLNRSLKICFHNYTCLKNEFYTFIFRVINESRKFQLHYKLVSIMNYNNNNNILISYMLLIVTSLNVVSIIQSILYLIHCAIIQLKINIHLFYKAIDNISIKYVIFS